MSNLCIRLKNIRDRVWHLTRVQGVHHHALIRDFELAILLQMVR
jgi:hypothetical protein